MIILAMGSALPSYLESFIVTSHYKQFSIKLLFGFILLHFECSVNSTGYEKYGLFAIFQRTCFFVILEALQERDSARI